MSKTYYMQSQDGAVFSTAFPEYHKECVQLSQAKGKEALRQHSIETLRKIVSPGQTVYTIVRSVAKSGMSRVISLFIVQDGELRNLDSLAADVLQWPMADGGGIKAGGCGMDMGFHTVYTLSRYLFKDGFKVDGRGRNGDESGWDNDGGYALKQQWM